MRGSSFSNIIELAKTQIIQFDSKKNSNEIFYQSHIEYLILILEIIVLKQRMHKNEHHMY